MGWMTRRDKITRFATQVIVALGCFLGAFTIAVLIIFCIKDSVPDALIYAVFGTAGVEAISLAAKRIFDKFNTEDDSDG